MSLLRASLLCAWLTTLPGVAWAQAPQEAVEGYLGARSECLEAYRLGSVHFSFAEDTSNRTFAPGGTVSIPGAVENTNAYPLPDGVILARVLRHDQAVATDHWHPVVQEVRLPGSFDLPASGSAPFTFTWSVPAQAPAGIYRVEFYFLAGGRYSMSGLTFVPNFTGGSQLFAIQGSANPAFVNFQRDTVRLNDAPLALRSVPPTLPAGQPLSVTVQLEGSGQTPIPVTVTAALHEWSDLDSDPPLLTTSEEVQLTPGQVTEIPFTWNAAQAGVYELVLTAKPREPGVLPSLLKVRFPVAGNTPRVIFSGITGFTRNEAEVTTCVVNGTFGSGTGGVATRVSSNGQEVAAASGEYDGQNLTTLTTRAPLGRVGDSLVVAVQAQNSDGTAVDKHEISYDVPSLLANEVAAARAARSQRLMITGGLIVGGLLVLVILITLMIRGRRKPPVIGSPPVPSSV